MQVAFHENDGNHDNDENDEDNCYKQVVECCIWGAKKHIRTNTKTTFHGIVPGFLVGFCLCFFTHKEWPEKKHINNFLAPTQSRDNPANLFMFMCFSFPEYKRKSRKPRKWWKPRESGMQTTHTETDTHQLPSPCRRDAIQVGLSTCSPRGAAQLAHLRSDNRPTLALSLTAALHIELIRSGPTIASPNRADLRTLFGSQGLPESPLSWSNSPLFQESARESSNNRKAVQVWKWKAQVYDKPIPWIPFGVHK